MNYYHVMVEGNIEYFFFAENELHLRSLVRDRSGDRSIVSITALDLSEQIERYEKKRKKIGQKLFRNLRAISSATEQIMYYEKCAYLSRAKDLYLYKISFLKDEIVQTEKLLFNNRDNALIVVSEKHQPDEIFEAIEICPSAKLREKESLLSKLEKERLEYLRELKSVKKVLSSLEHCQHVILLSNHAAKA